MISDDCLNLGTLTINICRKDKMTNHYTRQYRNIHSVALIVSTCRQELPQQKVSVILDHVLPEDGQGQPVR